MNGINDKCDLFLRDVYLYDIKSCNYSILKKIGIDVGYKDNKIKRNIEIGKLQKENKVLSNVMRSTVNAVIDNYIKINEIEDNIIVKQYDGFITNKKIKDLDTFINLPMREKYNYLVVSMDRKKFMGINIDERKISIKGVSNRYKAMDNFYNRFLYLNFASKKVLFNGLNKIEEGINKSDNIDLFSIQKHDEITFHFNKYGEITIKENIVNMINHLDINKERYFNHYIKPFTEPIYLEFF